MLPGHRQGNNNLAKWVAALHNQYSHMLLEQKKKSAEFTVWKSKQTKNPFVIADQSLEERGEEQSSIQMPKAWGSHSCTARTCTACSTVLQDCSAPALSTSTAHIRGRARHSSTGQEWQGDRSCPKGWQMTTCENQSAHHQCTKTQEFGAAPTLVLALGCSWQYLQDGSLRSHPLLPADREKTLFLHSLWPLWQK